MNRPPHPPADHADDELLSARLDEAVEGEDRAALEEHLAACTRCQERLAALTAPAPHLAVEPLDDVTRRRLVDDALDVFERSSVVARRSPTWHRSYRLVAAAAVTLLLAVGLTAVLSGGGDGTETVARAPAVGEGGGVPADVVIGDVGSLDDPATLRGYLGVDSEAGGGGAGLSAGGDQDASTGGSDGGAPESTDDADAGGDEAPPDPESVEAPQTARPSSAFTGSRSAQAPDPGARADAERCLGVLGDAMPDDAVIALVATGTFGGEAAVAIVVETETRFAAFVAARDDCTILDFQSFPR